jgi:hypothetical protein
MPISSQAPSTGESTGADSVFVTRGRLDLQHRTALYSPMTGLEIYAACQAIGSEA